MGYRVVIVVGFLSVLSLIGVARRQTATTVDSSEVSVLRAPAAESGREEGQGAKNVTTQPAPALTKVIEVPRLLSVPDTATSDLPYREKTAEFEPRQYDRVEAASHEVMQAAAKERVTRELAVELEMAVDLLAPARTDWELRESVPYGTLDMGDRLRQRSITAEARVGSGLFDRALGEPEAIEGLPGMAMLQPGPALLNDPLPELMAERLPYESTDLFEWYRDAPLGFSGPTSVLPTEIQENSHFVPIEDRWRVGFPEWDRYGLGHPPEQDYPYVEGRWWDPYNQNGLKGGYPIAGQNVFLELTAASLAAFNGRQVPTPTTPFESTFDPNREEFFGHPSGFFYTHFFSLSFDLFHGDAGFKQPEWRIKATPTFNVNYLAVEELGVVSPDVRRGRTRGRDDMSLQEWFIEKKLADLGPDYDTLSVRAGSQLFVSDFRGFVFADVNRGVRLFGTRLSNREQFNLIWFDQTEKETNSQLNTFDDRHQNTVVANYYRQDTIWPGYNAQLSFHYNRDKPSFLFDKNSFLARPDPVGVFEPHMVETYYVGWAGDGHINRFNINHAFYYVWTRQLEPLGWATHYGRRQDGGDRVVLRSRLGKVSHVVLLGLGRR